MNPTIPVPALWTQYMAKTYPGGVPPEVYRQIKIAFLCGLLEFFDLVINLEKRLVAPDEDLKKGAEDLEKLRQEIAAGQGTPIEAFEKWLARLYPNGTADNQRAILRKSWLDSMTVGFYACAILAGPDDEDDGEGAKRMLKMRGEVIEEIERLVVAA